MVLIHQEALSAPSIGKHVWMVGPAAEEDGLLPITCTQTINTLLWCSLLDKLGRPQWSSQFDSQNLEMVSFWSFQEWCCGSRDRCLNWGRRPRWNRSASSQYLAVFSSFSFSSFLLLVFSHSFSLKPYVSFKNLSLVQWMAVIWAPLCILDKAPEHRASALGLDRVLESLWGPVTSSVVNTCVF